MSSMRFEDIKEAYIDETCTKFATDVTTNEQMAVPMFCSKHTVAIVL